MEKSRIVLADSEIHCRGIRAMIGSFAEIIGETNDAKKLIQIIEKMKPDLLIADLSLSKVDVIELVPALKARAPAMKIFLFATATPTANQYARAHVEKADYMAEKSLTEAQFATHLERILLGGSAPEIDPFVAFGTQMQKRKDPISQDMPLTNRELQVLRHIALGLSNREIAQSLGISIETVKEHAQNIFRKIETADRTQAAVWAVKRGLV